jgi:hypothetical protein
VETHRIATRLDLYLHISAAKKITDQAATAAVAMTPTADVRRLAEFRCSDAFSPVRQPGHLQSGLLALRTRLTTGLPFRSKDRAPAATSPVPLLLYPFTAGNSGHY